MPISREEFQRAYPTLFHISRAQDVQQIMGHGLLSTAAILDLCEIRGIDRSRIETQPRPKAVPVKHSVHGDFVINDQAPLNAVALAKCLTDVTSQQWCESLNRRVFLWPTRARLAKHIGARLAEGRKQIVIAFDTRSLFDVLDINLFELSPINSGNTMRKAAPRGSKTFQTLQEYPFQERRKTRGLGGAIAEVTYLYAITPSKLASIDMSSELILR
jgi:hypothetical protein